MNGFTNASIKRGGVPSPIKEFSYYATHLDELATVLQKHYAGELDVTTVWSVGDTMEDLSLSSISATPSQSAQNFDLVILDFNHDTLSSDTSKKAALTVGFKDSLSSTGVMNSSYNSYTYARYTNSPLRTWLNSNLYGALPSDLQSLIKQVRKTSGYPTNSSNSQTTETTDEKCWLASNWELFGQNYSGYTSVTDGSQYSYYSTQSNRVKTNPATGNDYQWISRSGFWSSGALYVNVNAIGTTGQSNPVNPDNIIPHFCL